MTALNVVYGDFDDPAAFITNANRQAALEAAIGALVEQHVLSFADRFGGIGAVGSQRRLVLERQARHLWLRKLAGHGDPEKWERLRALGRGDAPESTPINFEQETTS